MRPTAFVCGLLAVIAVVTTACGNPGQGDIDRARPDVERIMAELPPVPGFIVVDDGITEPNNRPLELQLGTALIAYQVPTDLPSTASVLTAVDEHFTSLGYERLRLVVPYTCESEGIIRDVYFGTEEVSFLVAMYSPDAISVTLLWTRDGPIGKSTGGYTSVDQPFTCNG